MAIFEPLVMKEILKVTCSILQRNFFYEEESLKNFLDIFTYDISNELLFFEANVEQRILDELNSDKLARLHFTCYFVSAHLREIFIHKLHFTEQEIYAFESLLPKYTGDKKRNETEPKYTRTHHRKFFK